MKSVALFLLAGVVATVAQTNTVTEPPSKAVAISSAYINHLIAEADTNNPGLKAAASRVRSVELNAESIRNVGRST